MDDSDLWDQLLARGLSPRTAHLYRAEINRARRWCEEHGHDVERMTLRAVLAYAQTRPFTFSTRKMARDALRHLWDITGHPEPAHKAIRVPKRPRAVCKALEEDDARILGKAARARGDDAGLATCLALYQGLRRQEIATLRWECFDGRGWVTITGKADITATIPVHVVVAELLEARGWQHEGWVFPGNHGPSSSARIWLWIRKVTEEAGVGEIACHRLRHTAIATANDATGDLRSVQAFARHADPRTTAGYTRATTRRLRAVVDAIDY
ncbi:MAG TPA: tyrosine-type recombinase/integrase [Acidimicrobiales bacterium]|nr:tyrosine-type recombinase/integrase [Acidimicrobiales bacterium]